MNGLSILGLICAILGSVIVLAAPAQGLLLIICAVFFGWAGEERRKRGPKP